MAAYTIGTYTSPYAQQLKELYGQIDKRRNEEFSYDYAQDPVYQSMRKTALLDAQQSTADTLGRTSALTGGRSSTEAVRAAAQAGNNVKASLNNAVPDLYENAYNKWRNVYADMLSQYSMLQTDENTDYSRWLESENAKSTEEQLNYNRQQAETQYADTLKQQYYNNLVSLIGSTGYTPTQSELNIAGMTAEAAAALRSEYLRQVALQSASGSGGSSGYDYDYSYLYGDEASVDDSNVAWSDIRDTVVSAAASGDYDGAASDAELAYDNGLISASQYNALITATNKAKENSNAQSSVASSSRVSSLTKSTAPVSTAATTSIIGTGSAYANALKNLFGDNSSGKISSVAGSASKQTTTNKSTTASTSAQKTTKTTTNKSTASSKASTKTNSVSDVSTAASNAAKLYNKYATALKNGTMTKIAVRTALLSAQNKNYFTNANRVNILKRLGLR